MKDKSPLTGFDVCQYSPSSDGHTFQDMHVFHSLRASQTKTKKAVVCHESRAIIVELYSLRLCSGFLLFLLPSHYKIWCQGFSFSSLTIFYLNYSLENLKMFLRLPETENMHNIKVCLFFPVRESYSSRSPVHAK
ncbi:hypothetical protein XENOCAPTIV_028998 [Xenoophorus captivus]|uniref:Uncharacterized protein n=1 Tax=Xenoophorus captivus TaxID=1517983 RepID=A0ABV0RTM0_9TELE